jgi:hypothetical protein
MGEVSGDALLLERAKRGVDVGFRLRNRWRTVFRTPIDPRRWLRATSPASRGKRKGYSRSCGAGCRGASRGVTKRASLGESQRSKSSMNS